MLTTILLLLCSVYSVQGVKMSACFSQEQKSLDIKCRDGYMVRILHTFYGFSPTGKCSFHDGDCILPEYESYPCVGRQSCSINLPTGTYGSLVPSCGQYSNYFQVEYECVSDAETHDLCQVSTLTDQSGYISTPRYPNNFHNTLLCSVRIQAAPNQKILLYIIDMELEPKGKTDCSDLMYFNDGYHSITLCGRRSNDTFQSHGDYLLVELKASSGNSKGFWLYYEAFPKLPNYVPTTEVPGEDDNTAPTMTSNHPYFNKPQNNRQPITSSFMSKLTDRNEEITRDATSTPIPVFHDYVKNGGNSKTLPFAAIAGSVIGTLTLVLLVLLTLLAIKWLKERRYFQNKERFLEIRNPAFRSSGDFNQCNNDYNPYGNEYCYAECS
ncbi:hypothetical protein SNE40_018657 [Patella caerulea]|uniref:CUB domain-containing protein n=2 Tax=Patella caerulea TaxID=87958 RepID=A0AAN8J5A8_PATCE